jgi:hypothetical protein
MTEQALSKFHVLGPFMMQKFTCPKEISGNFLLRLSVMPNKFVITHRYLQCKMFASKESLSASKLVNQNPDHNGAK